MTEPTGGRVDLTDAGLRKRAESICRAPIVEPSR